MERRKPKEGYKGNPQAGTTCKAITNTFLGGGSARSSEEGSVMELERRGWQVQESLANHFNLWEERKQNRNLRWLHELEEPYELRGSRTVLWEAWGEIPLAYSTVVSLFYFLSYYIRINKV